MKRNIVQSGDGKSYNVVEEMGFDTHTPDDLCSLLVTLNRTRQRVLFVYGDVETGKMWESATPERGRIGRSTVHRGTFPDDARYYPRQPYRVGP